MPGPSGYNRAQTQIEPMDPNDRVRQKTQSRAGDYPYDKPVMYGQGLRVDPNTQAANPAFSTARPPVPRNKRPEDVPVQNAWNLAREALDTYEPGPNAPDAGRLGYGSHGRMGDGLDPLSMELDDLKQDFRNSFVQTLPVALSLPSRDLFSLLMDLDPEYTADLFAPEDDSEMQDTYTDWADKVYAPGAEEDPE